MKINLNDSQIAEYYAMKKSEDELDSLLKEEVEKRDFLRESVQETRDLSSVFTRLHNYVKNTNTCLSCQVHLNLSDPELKELEEEVKSLSKKYSKKLKEDKEKLEGIEENVDIYAHALEIKE